MDKGQNYGRENHFPAFLYPDYFSHIKRILDPYKLLRL